MLRRLSLLARTLGNVGQRDVYRRHGNGSMGSEAWHLRWFVDEFFDALVGMLTGEGE